MGVSPTVVARSWMLFVDGENFTIRGQKVAEANGFSLPEDTWHVKDAFLWIPGRKAHQPVVHSGVLLQSMPIRASYYTSMTGDERRLGDLRQRIKELGFQPSVFKKDRPDQKAKGVDIALATDMLSHAFRGNYEVAVLVAGDGDYVPLLEEVKRLGKWVAVWSFSSGLSPALSLCADCCADVTEPFLNCLKQASVAKTGD